MTNGDRGGALASEILRSIPVEYGWPDYRQQEKQIAAVGQETLRSYAGVYHFQNGPTITIMIKEGRLSAMLPQRGAVELLPESATSFFSANGEIPPLRFTRQADSSIELTAGGATAKRQ